MRNRTFLTFAVILFGLVFQTETTLARRLDTGHRATMFCGGTPLAPSGLISWWPLDSVQYAGHGGTTPNLVGSSASFAVQDAGSSFATALLVPGHVGMGFHIQDFSRIGAIGGLNAGASTSYNFGTSGDFTIDAWVAFQLQSSDQPGASHFSIFRKMDMNGNGYDFWVAPGGGGAIGILWLKMNGASFKTVAIAQTGWTHLTVRVSRLTGVTFLVNGALVSSTFSGVSTTGINVDTGADAVIGSGEGYIDEVEVFGRALSDSEILQIAKLGKCKSAMPVVQVCVAPPPDLDAWYPFDGNGNEKILGLNASAVGSPPYVIGKVLQGVGASAGYMRVPSTPVLNQGLGDFSIDAWVQFPPNLLTVRTLVDKRTLVAGKYLGYSVYLYKNYFGLQLADGGSGAGFTNYSNMAAPVQPITDGLWHHLAITVDRDQPNGLIFYIDGVAGPAMSPTARQGNLDNTAELRMGAQSFSSTTWGLGLDEVEFFDRVLTPLEVGAIYQAGPYGKCK